MNPWNIINVFQMCHLVIKKDMWLHYLENTSFFYSSKEECIIYLHSPRL